MDPPVLFIVLCETLVSWGFIRTNQVNQVYNPLVIFRR